MLVFSRSHGNLDNSAANFLIAYFMLAVGTSEEPPQSTSDWMISCLVEAILL